ncbi:hypothetical protein DSECCO2_577870 [anaerobic digester metagenome]
MKKIIFIPAKNSLINNRKLKVATYCRVSTERETQKNSIDIQIKYYTDLIQAEWDFAGVFYDYENGLVWILCLRRHIVVKLIISIPSLSVDCQEMC